jgi:serine/threonine protein kinase
VPTGGKKYQILKLVAKGGTAVMYKALQTSLDRVVAVKKLHNHLTEDENFTRRFVLEAKAAASLDHSNIVKIIDFGAEGASYYMVMEFIDGESLREILDRCKQVPLEVALALTYEVLGGLQHAHSKGIVHRDIKPGNIMVTDSGQVKITDFGLAKLLEGATHHTAADTVLGTPLYMSPEQAFGESVDQRSDIFSLGTMLYEMITGVQPFKDDNYMAVIQNIAKKNAPHPSKFNVEVPQQVQTMLSRAMNKNRDARFQNTEQFRKAIQDYLGHVGLSEARGIIKQLPTSTDTATLILPSTLARQKKGSRLRRGLMATVVAATLFGAAGMVWSLGPPEWREPIRTTVASWIDSATNPPDNIQAGNLTDFMVTALEDSSTTDSTASRPLNTAPNSTPRQAVHKPLTTQWSAGQSEKRPKPIPVDVSPTQTTQADPPPEKPKPKPKPAEKPKLGWLSVACDPLAEVYINNRYRGDTPLEIELPPGTHLLECRKSRYENYREQVRIINGELSRRNIVLKKLMAHISITATEGAEVLIDGVLVGVTPLRKPIEVEAGSHQITVKKAGFNVWNNQINLSAKETLPLNIILSPMY